MKKYSLFFIFIFLSGILITSCLGDSGQRITITNQPGVVIKSENDIKVELRDSVFIHSTSLSSGVDNGDCILLDYTLDYSLPVNADSGRREGFYTVEDVKFERIPQFTLGSVLDTLTKDSVNERRISQIQDRYGFIQDRFFLFTSNIVDSTDQINRYELAYNPASNPVSDKDYARLYNLYLRVFRDTLHNEGEGVTNPKTVYVNAFNLTEISEKERNAQNDSLFIKINYVSSFTTDSGKIASWGNKVFSLPLYSRRR